MTTAVNFRELETVVRRVPLGLRCVDVATGAVVTGGLSVTAAPLAGSSKTTAARAAQSGYYSFQNLPGLRDYEFAAGDESAASPPAGSEFAIRVEDSLGRYLPWGVVLTLPRETPLTFQLLSAPGRGAVPGLMAVTGSLRDGNVLLAGGGHGPAAFARVEAHYEADAASPPDAFVGLADARGEFALFLPGPNPLRPPAGVAVTSPNSAGRQTVSELRWPLTLSFFYEPARQRFLRARGRGGAEVVEGQTAETIALARAGGAVPELSSLLTQGPAEVFASAGGPAAVSLGVEVGFMKDFVARTAGAGSDVLLSPAVLSP